MATANNNIPQNDYWQTKYYTLKAKCKRLKADYKLLQSKLDGMNDWESDKRATYQEVEKLRGMVDDFHKQQTTWKETLKTKDEEINMLKEDVYIVEENYKILNDEHKELRIDVSEIFEQWNTNSYVELHGKLRELGHRWRIKDKCFDEILLSSFVRWSEEMRDFICNTLLGLPKEARTPGLHEMIQMMNNAGLFNGSVCQSQCDGNCGKTQCSAFRKEIFFKWKEQRNARVHFTSNNKRREIKLMDTWGLENLIKTISGLVRFFSGRKSYNNGLDGGCDDGNKNDSYRGY